MEESVLVEVLNLMAEASFLTQTNNTYYSYSYTAVYASLKV